jgi:hypothetical protein
MKKKVTNSDELEAAIAELELKAAAQKMDLQETFSAVSENLKPLNLVKNGVRSVFSGEHKEDILNALIGLGSGFLSRRLILGKSTGIMGKTVGKAIQWGMAGLVSKNAEKIKEKAGELIDRFFKKNKRPGQTPASQAERIELKAQSRR